MSHKEPPAFQFVSKRVQPEAIEGLKNVLFFYILLLKALFLICLSGFQFFDGKPYCKYFLLTIALY